MNAINETTEREELRELYRALDVTDSVTMRLGPSVGAGFFGDIYKGDWTDTSKTEEDGTLALKVIRRGLVSKSEERAKILRRLKQEISVWRDAKHPNIHPFRGLWWYKDWPFPAMVSTWEEKGNLNEYLDKLPRSLSAGEVNAIKLDLLEGVLEGMAYLHGRKVIHADIKGENVLVSSEGKALLCDFGVSWTSIKRSVSFTVNRGAIGTVEYMAPEFFPQDDKGIVGGELLYTEASDMWAFGCVFYEVFSGSPLWRRELRTVDIARALGDKKPFDRPSVLDNHFWNLFLSCCAFEAAARPPASAVILEVKVLRNGPSCQ